MSLKGVIFGIDEVLLSKTQGEHRQDVYKLLRYLINRGVEIVVLANRDWNIGGRPFDQVFVDERITLSCYIYQRTPTIPKKPKKEAIDHILSQKGWLREEVIYIGNSDMDMQAAVNSKLLFLNARWYGQNQNYGVSVETPKDVARFIDIFCLRDHWWHYSLKSGNSEFYSLGPYGTREAKYSVIAEDARAAAKFGTGHPEFWIRYLLSTVYFGGLIFDYIAIYPSSDPAGRVTGMEETVKAFGNCFRKSFISDLIVRHTQSEKSAYARASGKTVDHQNQLHTIRLVKLPKKTNGDRYRSSPLGSGKTVLVIDDFCTQGNSLEAARLFIEQTGAKTIGLSLLKTLFNGYREITDYEPKGFDPFSPATFSTVNFVEHPYNGGITDGATHEEIGDKLARYDSWDWPSSQ
jgi:hypothetical protein